MFSTNAPWAPSGYGQQASQFLPKIRNLGYEMACVCFYGLMGGKINWKSMLYEHEPFVCYPKTGSQWGEDAMRDFHKEFKQDVSFTLQDIWTMNPDILKEVPRWIPIVPIDHEPPPPAIIDRLKLAYRIITYSKFGHRELKKVGLHSTYIPHTIDTNMFKAYDKAEMKQKLGINPDTFLFGMVSANKDMPPRKSFQEVLDAFHLFQQKYPNSALYFHSIIRPPGGFPIDDYAKNLGIDKKIFHTLPHDLLFSVPQEEMGKLYSAFDVLLCPSTNEGFGVPIIEAQACEVPVIVNDFTAMPELIIEGETGEKCKVAWRRFSALGSYVGHPDTKDLVEKMEKLYHADREKMGKAARKHVEENYDIDVVIEKHWKPFLETLENEIHKG